jgi:hypothetical protein
MTENVPYHERFPAGTKTRIADRAILEEFMANWKYHNKLQPEQLEYGGRVTTVAGVGFYHGGDAVYKLDGIPDSWLDQCLREP